ncbi:MAG: response regulator transcription factor [Pseudonocardia sp.]|nr:response regulator transcription factor [Pseudonocardia sp.]
MDDEGLATVSLLPRPRTGPEHHRPRVLPLQRVLLVSANGPQRTTWKRGLHGLARSVEEACTLTDARARALETPPLDLVLVDAGVADTVAPGSSPQGCPAGSALAGLVQTARIVVCGEADDRESIQLLLRSGARGYLFGRAPEPAPREPEGRPDPDAAERMLRVQDVDGRERLLTRREVEIIRYAADGETNIEIGRRLGVSPLTVKSHLGRIGRRLGTGDRASIVMLALRAGAIS